MDNYEDFISTVSHELRTPLTSIRGFSQTMLASWDKLDDESKKKYLLRKLTPVHQIFLLTRTNSSRL